MRKLLIILAAAILGYTVFEFLRRYLAMTPEAGAPLRQMGPVKGAAMTAGGQGAARRTLDADGGSVSHRVGRGVIHRKAKAKA